MPSAAAISPAPVVYAIPSRPHAFESGNCFVATQTETNVMDAPRMVSNPAMVVLVFFKPHS